MVSWLGTDGFSVGRPPDLRLAAPAVATWLTVLGALAVAPWISWVFAALVAGLALGVLVVARPPVEAVALGLAATLGCSATAAAVTGLHLYRVEHSSATAAAGRPGEVEFVAQVRTDPRARAGQPRPGRAEWVITARNLETRGSAPVVLLASGPEWGTLLPGQRVRARGAFLQEEDPMTAALVAVRGPPEGIGPVSRTQAFADGVRERLREAAEVLDRPERGLLPALIVGDVSEIGAQTTEDFRATGMSHLLTVSGANLAVLTGFVLAVAKLARAPTWCSVAGGAVMIWLFVLVCRPEPSVVRAAFMGSIALLALATGRAHAGLGALSATVVGVLFAAPGLASSYGFALSVLATAGILLWVPAWSRTWSRRVPRPLAEACAVALAAQLAVSPVLVLLSGEVSWVAVPANVLAAPVVATVTVLGALVAALASLGAAPFVAGTPWLTGVWDPAVGALVRVPGLGVSWIAGVAEYGARVPHGAFPWRGDVVGALVLAVLLALLLAARSRRWLRVVAAGVVAVLVLALASRCLPGGWPPAGWAVVACDVGQGDAFVLSVGDGSAVVFDTGMQPEAVDGCLSDLGVSTVPLLVLSHDHADHVDGTPGVLRHRTVPAALVPSDFTGSPVGDELAEGGVRTWVGERGSRVRVGPWTLRVLWPDPDFDGSSNDRSLVVRADGPVSVLLTGDVEEEAQERLLSLPGADLLSVGVLNTPHHGGGTQVPEFLAATSPEMTLTSVGEDNPYGHPAPFTLRLLEGISPVNLRTDRDGPIAVLPGGGTGPPRGVVRGPAPDRGT
ncbi:ComEC/Rec2 family competence protein [Nocardiopsis kunsanensis]|uniref:Competence protein ComEC n=1 Tax=Nocardiopsis kunsanensis TaxID=141693 RepID=A0A918X5U4_9ACTN|nr:ComEC/Rec2 family competence protein [Nocardiopsis kunsanensis]GHD14498.1 competence protein ComEC [Nocardiopsis kunsanensis]